MLETHKVKNVEMESTLKINLKRAGYGVIPVIVLSRKQPWNFLREMNIKLFKVVQDVYSRY